MAGRATAPNSAPLINRRAGRKHPEAARRGEAEREVERPGWAVVRLLPLLGVSMLVWAVFANGGSSVGDEGPFLAAAHRLLHGQYALVGAMDGTKFLWHGPGLPALISPLVAIGAPLSVIRLLGPLLLFAAVVVFYRLLRLRLSRRIALIGAYALGLYAPMYEGVTSLQKEPLALLMSLLALYGTARYVAEGGRRHLLLAGLALGGLAMTRLEFGWVITALLAGAVSWWLVARFRNGARSRRALGARRWALVCGVGMLACVPWLAYTYSITHHLFYGATRVGSRCTGCHHRRPASSANGMRRTPCSPIRGSPSTGPCSITLRRSPRCSATSRFGTSRLYRPSGTRRSTPSTCSRTCRGCYSAFRSASGCPRR